MKKILAVGLLACFCTACERQAVMPPANSENPANQSKPTNGANVTNTESPVNVATPVPDAPRTNPIPIQPLTSTPEMPRPAPVATPVAVLEESGSAESTPVIVSGTTSETTSGT